MTQPPAPIALFVYNRLDTLRQVVEALANNELADQSDVIVYSDGARTSADLRSVDAVRSYCSSIAGFRSIRVVEREKNLGLAKSIVAGVTEILEKHGRVIVLEDDLVTSPFFLRYMNDALNLYEEHDEVASIHGYVYPTGRDLPETFFLRGADCWGWGTWSRAWKHFSSDASSLLMTLRAKNLESDFDFNNTFHYTRMLEQQVAGRIDSWAICWYASAFLKNKLTLYPGRSLVNHIGIDRRATHAAGAYKLSTTISSTPIEVRPIPVEEHLEARKAFEEFFRRTKDSLLERVSQGILNLPRRLKRSLGV